MSLNKDYRLHLLMGTAAVVATATIIAINRYWGLGAAAAAATTMLGSAYELVQAYRKEGDPSPWDALATASTGWAFWLIHYIATKG